MREGTISWQRYIDAIPLGIFRHYYEAGRKQQRKPKNVVPMPPERMIFPFPPIVKEEK